MRTKLIMLINRVIIALSQGAEYEAKEYFEKLFDMAIIADKNEIINIEDILDVVKDKLREGRI